MLIFSTIGIFVRYINLPNPVIIFFTSLFGFMVLTGYFAYKRKIKAVLEVKQKTTLMISGVLVALNLLFFYMAYSLTTFANSVLTHYTAPIFAALLAPFYLKERLEKITVLSLVVSFSGLIIITSNSLSFNNPNILGILFGTLSGVFYGLSILVNKRLTNNIESKVIMVYQAFVCLMLMAPFLFLTKFSLSVTSISLLIVYALIVYISASLIYLTGLKRVEAQHAGIIAYAEPIFVFILGFLFFKEIPTIRTYIGGLLILYSGYLILRAESKRT